MEWEYPLTRYVLRPVSIPLARRLVDTFVAPGTLTVLSLAAGLAASLLVFLGHLVVGTVVLVVSLVLDVADGDLARLTNRVTRAGAFLDSVFDRIVDSSFTLALILTDLDRLWFWGYLFLTGSLLVSYVRTRAEAVGVACKVGFASRDLRLIVLMASAFLSVIVREALFYAFVLLAILAFVTVIQRVAYTYPRAREGLA